MSSYYPNNRKRSKKEYRKRKAFDKYYKKMCSHVCTRQATQEELDAIFGKGEDK